MKTYFKHRFTGYNGVKSSCNVYIVSEQKDEYYILFENMGDGLSVTNASEQLASEIIERMQYHPDNCRFFETYLEYKRETFDEITYNWVYDLAKSWVASNPSWKPAEEMRNLFFKKE